MICFVRYSRSLVFLACLLLAARLAAADDPDDFATTGPVGPRGENSFVTPVNQLLTPAGRQIKLPGLRPQALALSPNGRLLAISGKTAELLIADPITGALKQRVPLPTFAAADPKSDRVSDHILRPDKDAEVSYTGLEFSPDGSRIYLSSVNGTIKVFSVDAKGKVAGVASWPLPPARAPRRKLEIPAGLAISRDGKRLYVALNLSNRLAELDAQTGEVLRLWKTGVAPYTVVLARDKAYVSNWGGRRPEAGTLTGPAGRGTTVRVDPVRDIASEGSVTIVEVHSPKSEVESPKSKVQSPKSEIQSLELEGEEEILTGLHASGMAVSPDGKYIVVANAASDTLSVIETRQDRIVETICARLEPGDLFGASPNALAFDRSGRVLYVCNGTQNAVAVFHFSPARSRLLGLIPVGWYPGAILVDARRRELYIANIKGFGSGKRLKPGEAVKFNSHQYFGSVSMVAVPSSRQLAAYTPVVLRNLRRPRLEAAALPARPDQPPRPVPERAGEPSVFKHVVYIIKENRTYDQVLGDVKEGNGDPSLCVFGERITPNEHKLVREFALLDNTYCSGICSADGHQWATTAMATDYMEKSFAGFPRSYPDGMEDDDVDALAYSPAGFIWDDALAHGKTFRDYGEFAITDKAWRDKRRKTPIKFLDHWCDFTNGTPAVQLSSRPAVESLRPYLDTETVGWDLDVPDVFRAAQFIKELKACEAKGSLPQFIIFCLPNDHTSGTSPGAPTPAAQVADNDLALGRIVEAISHSRFWADTCILVIEDDPQAGWDHVNAFRTTVYAISPYTRRHQVVSTQFNQVSLLRTIELILGLPPMNQIDATATPMSDCFTVTPDLTPFTALPTNIPLDQLNPEPKKIADPLLRRYARLSAGLPLAMPDQCPEDLLNRILWHAMKGSQSPYPEWAVSAAVDKD